MSQVFSGTLHISGRISTLNPPNATLLLGSEGDDESRAGDMATSHIAGVPGIRNNGPVEVTGEPGRAGVIWMESIIPAGAGIAQTGLKRTFGSRIDADLLRTTSPSGIRQKGAARTEAPPAKKAPKKAPAKKATKAPAAARKGVRKAVAKRPTKKTAVAKKPARNRSKADTKKTAAVRSRKRAVGKPAKKKAVTKVAKNAARKPRP